MAKGQKFMEDPDLEISCASSELTSASSRYHGIELRGLAYTLLLTIMYNVPRSSRHIYLGGNIELILQLKLLYLLRISAHMPLKAVLWKSVGGYTVFSQ